MMAASVWMGHNRNHWRYADKIRVHELEMVMDLSSGLGWMTKFTEEIRTCENHVRFMWELVRDLDLAK